MHKRVTGLLAATALSLGLAVPAQSAPIVVEQWDLFSHPNGSESNPVYGLRLDGLYGDLAREWTFQFEDTDGNSRMQMQRIEDGGTSSIRIFGTLRGGELNESRNKNANLTDAEAYNAGRFGDWFVDFTYADNVFVDGDRTGDTSGVSLFQNESLFVSPMSANNVGIIAPLFDLDFTAVDESLKNGTSVAEFIAKSEELIPDTRTIALEDEQGNHGYSFVYADDNHRCGSDQDCLDRFVGRGWVNHARGYDGEVDPHVYASDWLFTGQASVVPVPAALPLLLTALAGLGLVSRRRKAA